MSDHVLAQLTQIIGTPFVDRGRTPGVGLDCWGTVMAVYAAYDVDLPDYGIPAYAGAQVHRAYARESESALWRRVDRPVFPCVIMMATNHDHPDMCTHAGVYIGRGEFIHALDKVGVVKDRITSPAWKQAFRGYYVYVG